MIIHITLWLVHFRSLPLPFLTSKIGTILILNFVSYFFASSEHPTLNEALDKACSRYVSSDAHSAVKGQFLLSPKQHSIQQFTEFILSCPLWSLLFASYQGHLSLFRICMNRFRVRTWIKWLLNWFGTLRFGCWMALNDRDAYNTVGRIANAAKM